MSAFAIILVMVGAAFMQAWLPAVGMLGMAKPPLILSVVIYYALTRGRLTILGAALTGGILQDSLEFMPLGSSSLCFCLAGLLIHATRDWLIKDSLLTESVLAAVGAALMTVATRLLIDWGEFEQAPPIGGGAWTIGIKAGGTALLAAIAAIPIFWAARGMDMLIGAGEAAS